MTLPQIIVLVSHLPSLDFIQAESIGEAEHQFRSYSPIFESMQMIYEGYICNSLFLSKSKTSSN
jgi:hypothetical protein